MSRERIMQRQHAQGYLSPALRPGCRNCVHAAEPPDQLRRLGDPMECRLGRFLVSPGGVCDHHAPVTRKWQRRAPPTWQEREPSTSACAPSTGPAEK